MATASSQETIELPWRARYGICPLHGISALTAEVRSYPLCGSFASLPAPDDAPNTANANNESLPPPKPPSWRVEEHAAHGYPKLARLTGEKDFAIYKRFAALNSRNLLYQQARLVYLEHELHDMEKHLAVEDQMLHTNFGLLLRAEPGTAAYSIMEKSDECSRALERYNRLFLDQQRLLNLPRPDATLVDNIYNFLNQGNHARLEFPENAVYAIWDDNRSPIQTDLITLNRDFEAQDLFTRIFTTKVAAFSSYWYRRISYRFMKLRSPDIETGAVELLYENQFSVSDKKARAVATVIAMLMASAMPTSSIVALYYIDSAVWRLAFIVLFSAFFASTLAIFTKAKRIEIFSASLALASVQVVFVGTAFGSGGGGS